MNVAVEIVNDGHLGVIGEIFHCNGVIMEVLVAFLADHLTLTVDDGSDHEEFGIFESTFEAHSVLDDLNFVQPGECLKSHVNRHLAVH